MVSAADQAAALPGAARYFQEQRLSFSEAERGALQLAIGADAGVLHRATRLKKMQDGRCDTMEAPSRVRGRQQVVDRTRGSARACSACHARRRGIDATEPAAFGVSLQIQSVLPVHAIGSGGVGAA